MENITLTFNGLTAGEAAALVATIRPHPAAPAPGVAESTTAVVEPTTEPAASAPKPRRGRKPKAESQPAAPEPATDTTPPSGDLPLAQPASIEDVRKALSDLLAAKGMSACTKLLAGFGAARIGELAPEKYGAVIAACKEQQA